MLFSGCARVLSTRGLGDGQRGVVGPTSVSELAFLRARRAAFCKGARRIEWFPARVGLLRSSPRIVFSILMQPCAAVPYRFFCHARLSNWFFSHTEKWPFAKAPESDTRQTSAQPSFVVARVLFSGCARVLSTRGLSDGQRGVFGPTSVSELAFLPARRAAFCKGARRIEWFPARVGLLRSSPRIVFSILMQPCAAVP